MHPSHHCPWCVNRNQPRTLLVPICDHAKLGLRGQTARRNTAKLQCPWNPLGRTLRRVSLTFEQRRCLWRKHQAELRVQLEEFLWKETPVFPAPSGAAGGYISSMARLSCLRLEEGGDPASFHTTLYRADLNPGHARPASQPLPALKSIASLSPTCVDPCQGVGEVSCCQLHRQCPLGTSCSHELLQPPQCSPCLPHSGLQAPGARSQIQFSLSGKQ